MMSEEEIWEHIHNNNIKILHQHAVLYGHPIGSKLRESFTTIMKEVYNIPPKQR
tara:strand:- start:60 stop:221 length:162 start_codon:yes stop_codon:yes gene_type:complete